MKSYKKWSIGCLLTTVLILIIGGAITTVIDPFFHYHAPLNFLEYPINNQRYQNDGIAKNFKYDAIIIGTSMVENFKTTEFDEVYNVHSIKVPYSGASYKEINDALERAIKANPELGTVIRCLDYNRLMDDKNALTHEPDSYPNYLYDDFLLNDTNYIFNKTVLFRETWEVIAYTKQGEKTPGFDEYCSWSDASSFGKEFLDASYKRPEKSKEIFEMQETDYIKLRENITQNVINLAQKNPQVKFYYFFPPYSIYYWDSLYRKGNLEAQLNAEKEALELILECDNVYIFSFFDEFDLICNLDNYKDFLHYSGEINSQILKWMNNGEHRITKENYKEYCDIVYDFYTSYDYDTLFVE